MSGARVQDQAVGAAAASRQRFGRVLTPQRPANRGGSAARARPAVSPNRNGAYNTQPRAQAAIANQRNHAPTNQTDAEEEKKQE